MIGADVRAGVENARGERPLLLGKPFGDGLDRGRKIARLADPKREPRDGESPNAAGKCVRRRGQRPNHKRDAVAPSRADPVHHPAGEQKADRVGQIERGVDVAVLRCGPADLLLAVPAPDTPSTARST